MYNSFESCPKGKNFTFWLCARFSQRQEIKFLDEKHHINSETKNMTSSKDYNAHPTENEPISQTATSRENGLGGFSSAVAEGAGSYSAQPEAYEPRVALAMAIAASQKVRVRVGTATISQRADQVVSQTLANAEFLLNHMVWVAGVDENAGYDSLNRPVDKVRFTYTGTPFYNPAYNSEKPRDGWEYWPSHDGVSDTVLPWHSNPLKGSKGDYISSTEMVWKWKHYDPDNAAGTDYLDGGTQYATISTRYYDGSG
jgi:hypothetical protein